MRTPTEDTEQRLRDLFAADARAADTRGDLAVTLVDGAMAKVRRRRRATIAGFGAVAVVMVGASALTGALMDRQPARPSAAAASASSGPAAGSAGGVTARRPWDCAMPRAAAGAGPTGAYPNLVLATVAVGEQVSLPVSMTVPAGVAVTSAWVVVQKPGTAVTIPVAAGNVLLTVPLPPAGGTRVIRFTPSVPGRYLVGFEARSHPPSDCRALRDPAVKGQNPSGSSAPSAARPSSVALSPATWADQDTDNGLGVIVVR